MSTEPIGKFVGNAIAFKVAVALLGTVGVLLVSQIYQALSHYRLKYRKLLDLPTINLHGNRFAEAETEYIAKAPQLLRQGREQFPQQPFQLWGPEGFVTILPEAWIEELKHNDVDTLDHEAVIRGVIGDYNWIQIAHPLGPIITRDLTPKLGTLMNNICEELRYCIRTGLPTCKDWEPVKVLPFMMDTVAVVSGRLFVGPSLNRNPKWIKTSTQFVLDLFKAGERVRKLPYYFAVLGIKLRLISEVELVYKHRRQASDLIVPLLAERTKARQNDPNWAAPHDMMQWIMDSPESAHKGFDEQALMQLILAMSAIQATSFVATNLIFDLAATPECIEPLRVEIQRVLAEGGGEFDKKSMAKMTKLDSFLKESQRLNPSQHITFDREVTAKNGITLKNGFHLPQGSRIAVASTQVARKYENADEFDGLRFERLRNSSAENALRYQFVTTNSYNAMSFGIGKHACPGRFFAATLIKVIAATLILEYDIKLPPKTLKRPESIVFGHNQSPSLGFEVLLKKRDAE